MRQEYQDRTHCFWFESFAEMGEEVAKTWDICKAVQQGFRASNKTGRSFNSFNEVLQAINSYWSKGMETYERAKGKLDEHHLNPPKTIRRRSVWDEDSGDELCLDRLRSAQPYWRTTKRDTRPGPVNVTLICDMATHWTRNPEQVAWRGVASVVLTELLEQSGYRVELWAVETVGDNYTDGGNYTAGVCMKRPSDVLDISSLINCLSPWSYRIIFFGGRSINGKRSCNSLGQPLPPKTKLFTEDEQVLICSNIWSETEAVRWIEQQLEKFKSGEFSHS